MLITIYDSHGTPKAELSPNDSSTQVKEVQGDSVLTLSFTHYDHIALDVDDYVDFEGERFWLTEKYKPKQNARKEWAYDIKLYGVESMLKRLLVIKTVDNEEEPVFTLTVPPHEHVAMIVKCMNNGFGNITDWKVGQVNGTENIVIDYFGKYCDEALKEIAEKVGAEWWVDGQTVNICKCEHGEAITMGYNNGLLSIDPGTADNVKFYTRLYPVGSSRNIDRGRYGFTRLQLPGGAKYVEINADKYGRVDHCEQDAFADIYPRRTGTVSSVRTEERTGEDGKPFTIYYFKDEGLEFDPNDYEIGGLVKRVSFQEGSELAGLGDEDNGTYYFEVNFDSKTREFEIITIWPYDSETQLPGDMLVPKAGDRYILWNLRMPDEYYALAEEEFLAAVKRYNAEHGLDISVYKAPTDHVWIEDNEVTLTIGQRIRLESEKYFPESGYRESRITKISRKVNLPSFMDIEIGDTLSRTSLERVTDSITEARGYAQGLIEGLRLPDLIREGDLTKPTDNNIFSARRSIAEFCSRKLPESIRSLWRFLKGIRVGAYAAGKSGAAIDEGGNGEFESLSARKSVAAGERVSVGDFREGASGGSLWLDEDGRVHCETDFMTARVKFKAREVEIQEITHVGGMQIVSPAGMRCSRVTKVMASGATVGYKCYFAAADGDGKSTHNKFRVGDLARCETFNLERDSEGWVGNRYYWRRVNEIGSENTTNGGKEHYIVLSNMAGEMDALGTTAPEAGDSIVTFGNDTEPDRQNLIVVASYGEGSPYIYQFKGIDTFALTGKHLKTAIAPGGNQFTGRFVVEADGKEIELKDYVAGLPDLDLYQLTLSRESAVVGCDSEGAPIGELPSCVVKVYKGSAVDEGWEILRSSMGCATSYAAETKTLRVTELTAATATVTVTARKEGCPALTKVFTIAKSVGGKDGEDGKPSTVYTIEPSAPMVLADMDGLCAPARLTCRVYKTVGDAPREELTAADGPKLKYTVVRKPVTATEVDGAVSVTAVAETEPEREYPAEGIVTDPAMRQVVFKLCEGDAILALATVLVQTDTSIMRAMYDARLEVTDKRIKAEAERLTAVKKEVASLLITAQGIISAVENVTGMIDDPAILDGAGRNLLLFTNRGPRNWTYHTQSQTAWQIAADESGGARFTTAPREDSGYEAFHFIGLRPEAIKEGEDYTLSFTLANRGSSEIRINASLSKSNNTSALTNVAQFAVAPKSEADYRISFRAVASGSADSGQGVRLGVVGAYINRWTDLTIRDMMLTKGGTFAPSGGNLLPNAGAGPDGWVTATDSSACVSVSKTLDGGVRFTVGARSDASYSHFRTPLKPGAVKSGDACRVSVSVKNGGTSELSVGVVPALPDCTEQLCPQQHRRVAPGMTEKISFTFIADRDSTPSHALLINATGASVNGWRNVELSGVALEKGAGTAHQWQAAPEDSLPEDYQNLKTRISQTAEKIELIARNFNADGSVKEGAGIMTTAKGIAMFAFNADGKLVSLVEQTPASIKVSAENISLEGATSINGKVRVGEDGLLRTEDASVAGRLTANELILGAERMPADTDPDSSVPVLTKAMSVCAGGYFALPALPPGSTREMRILVMGRGSLYDRQNTSLTLYGNTDPSLGNKVLLCQEGDLQSASDSLRFSSGSTTENGKTTAHYAFGVYLLTGFRLPTDDAEATADERATTYWNVAKPDDSAFVMRRLNLQPVSASAGRPVYNVTRPFDTIIDDDAAPNKPIPIQ